MLKSNGIHHNLTVLKVINMSSQQVSTPPVTATIAPNAPVKVVKEKVQVDDDDDGEDDEESNDNDDDDDYYAYVQRYMRNTLLSYQSVTDSRLS